MGWLPVTWERGIVQPPDESPGRQALTAQGPRVSLVGSEVVHPPVEIRFTVEVLRNQEVTPDLLRSLMEYGRYKGIGQWRNASYGTFDYTWTPR
jgi:hypothetical protein